MVLHPPGERSARTPQDTLTALAPRRPRPQAAAGVGTTYGGAAGPAEHGGEPEVERLRLLLPLHVAPLCSVRAWLCSTPAAAGAARTAAAVLPVLLDSGSGSGSGGAGPIDPIDRCSCGGAGDAGDAALLFPFRAAPGPRPGHDATGRWRPAPVARDPAGAVALARLGAAETALLFATIYSTVEVPRLVSDHPAYLLHHQLQLVAPRRRHQAA
mmetsp:Transcript_6315/g.15633  ORF Transcript_6315/g.15633 Transcript_6315/m.15633 type:complete len:213 (-) Transcript_6315:957-1595(-)